MNNFVLSIVFVLCSSFAIAMDQEGDIPVKLPDPSKVCPSLEKGIIKPVDLVKQITQVFNKYKFATHDKDGKRKKKPLPSQIENAQSYDNKVTVEEVLRAIFKCQITLCQKVREASSSFVPYSTGDAYKDEYQQKMRVYNINMLLPGSIPAIELPIPGTPKLLEFWNPEVGQMLGYKETHVIDDLSTRPRNLPTPPEKKIFNSLLYTYAVCRF